MIKEGLPGRTAEMPNDGQNINADIEKIKPSCDKSEAAKQQRRSNWFKGCALLEAP